MRAALLRAAPDYTHAQRLRALAHSCVRQFGGNSEGAVDSFIAAVRHDRGLLSALLDDETARRLAMPLLEIAARDLRGPEKIGDGEAQMRSDRPLLPRSSPPVDQLDVGEGVPSTCGRQPLSSASPASSNSEGGDEHASNERLSPDLSSPSEPSPSVQHRNTLNAPTEVAGRSVPKRGPAKLKSIYERFKLRDDFPIGDLRWSAIPRFKRANKIEDIILSKLANLPPPNDFNKRVREHVSEAELESIIAAAKKEAEDAI